MDALKQTLFGEATPTHAMMVAHIVELLCMQVSLMKTVDVFNIS